MYYLPHISTWSNILHVEQSSDIYILNESILNTTRKPLASSDDDHNRYLVIGYGHSSTSYIQQFISEVLLNKSDTFLLFEPDHIHNIKSYSTKHQKYDDGIPTLITSMLIDFFHCNFSNMAPFQIHLSINAYINNLYNPKNIYTELINLCDTKKNLVYKSIHFQSKYAFPMLSLLWRKYPNLKVFTAIRNPFNHIPSYPQLEPHGRSIKQCVEAICYQQYDNLKYANNMKWNQNPSKYQVINTDNFWKMIDKLKQNEIGNENFIGNSLQLLFNINITDNKDINLYKYRFDNMKQWPSSLGFGKHRIIKRSPFTDYPYYSWTQIFQYIAANCTEFIQFGNFSSNITYYINQKRQEIN